MPKLALRSFLGAAVLAALTAVPAALPAQELGRVATPILTLDRDSLYAGTLYGQRVSRELEAASNALAAETRRIEAALEEEEKGLTEKRATLSPEDFRALADAFDEKVQSLRSEREQAQTNMRSQMEAAQNDFFNRIGPVLGQLVRERGATLIVDRRAILLAATDVDITQAAIERIDAVLGDGSTAGDSAGGDITTPDSTGDSTTETPAEAPAVDTIPAPADQGTETVAPDTTSAN